jgi:diacylglycerol kinase (ATP)
MGAMANPGERRATTLLRAFGHAWDGLVDAARGQRNMRIHLVAGILATGFAALAPLAAAPRALLLLCTALVIAAEAGNTALEALVDLQGGAPSAPARLAKDAAAGAVLVLAAASVLVFALVAADGWETLLAAAGALAGAGVATLALGATAAILVAPSAPRGAAGALVAAGGVTLVVLLAATATCAPCAAAPALLYAVVAAAWRRGPLPR